MKAYMPLVPEEKALKPPAYCSTAAICDLLMAAKRNWEEMVRSAHYSSSVKVAFVGR